MHCGPIFGSFAQEGINPIEAAHRLVLNIQKSSKSPRRIETGDIVVGLKEGRVLKLELFGNQFRGCHLCESSAHEDFSFPR